MRSGAGRTLFEHAGETLVYVSVVITRRGLRNSRVSGYVAARVELRVLARAANLDRVFSRS